MSPLEWRAALATCVAARSPPLGWRAIRDRLHARRSEASSHRQNSVFLTSRRGLRADRVPGAELAEQVSSPDPANLWTRNSTAHPQPDCSHFPSGAVLRLVAGRDEAGFAWPIDHG